MKKIVIGICGFLVFIGGLAGTRSGVLKAGERIEESSLMVETNTVESAISVPESVEISTDKGGIPIEAQPEVHGEGETELSVPTVSSELTTESSSESTPVENSTDSTTSSSSSSTSTSHTSSNSSSNSLTSSDAKSGSSTKPSTTFPSSSVSLSSSTSQSNEELTQPVISETPVVVPSTPTVGMPITPVGPSVQANSFVASIAPEAFSERSTLSLPSELKATEVALSDLKGFELPLLSSFKDKAQAALIYEGVKQVGTEQKANYDAKQLATELYRNIAGLELTDNLKKLQKEIHIGSLVYREEKENHILLGIYIGDGYYLTVDDVEIGADESELSNVKESGPTEDTTEELEEKVEKNRQREIVVEAIDLEEDLLIQELPKMNLTKYGEQVLAEYPASMNFTENEVAKNFIKKIAKDAQKLGQEYDVFASVMIAQALLESGSGTSTLSQVPNHNLFGIKGTYQGQSISMATQEDRGNGELYSINSAFRKYPNYTASLGDYVELLRGGISGNDAYYKNTWRSTAKNYLRTTSALTGTYATDTTYGRKLNSIIALYHLTQYDQVKITGSHSGIFIKGKEDIPVEYRNRMKYPDYNGVDYNRSGSYPVGQCTWYAFNRVKQLGKNVDDYMGNGGEWATKGNALGYEVSQKPKVGWLISFKPGVAGSDPRYGHVAFVEAVRPEGILISEGNVYGGTVISYRVIDQSLANSDQVSYIKAK
ncbi:glucosaminidase domain-containing protein [Enterococcus sp. DIV0187]|uniref:glucosaminidase domain-containing protein n=1 Tax=Enterococcus sp. DIV0187 TaxID=2774644 RepID=UPI003F1F07A8